MNNKVKAAIAGVVFGLFPLTYFACGAAKPLPAEAASTVPAHSIEILAQRNINFSTQIFIVEIDNCQYILVESPRATVFLRKDYCPEFATK